MFKKLIYQLDRHNVLSTCEIYASALNSHGFTLYSQSDNTIQIVRRYKKPEDDPYNEDGRPPTLISNILMSHINFCGHYVEIIGVENANLIYAGSVLEPYNEKYDCKKLGDIEILSRKEFNMYILDYTRRLDELIIGRPVQKILCIK